MSALLLGSADARWLYATDPVARLPSSLSNLVSLNILHVTGNNSLPAGPFPTSILSLRNLTQITIGNTALTGAPLAFNGSTSSALQSLSLNANPGLGNAVPDASKFDKLQTLCVDLPPSSLTHSIITNQNMSRPFDASLFPPSLTYL